MNEKRSYKVTIFGDQYTLVSDESQDSILESATLLDSLMKDIAEKSKIADAKKVAVLAALRIANSLVHTESVVEAYANKEQRLTDFVDQALNKKGL